MYNEDCRQSQTDNGAKKETFGAHAIGQELLGHADLPAVPTSILGLGAGDDEGDAQP
jgi:hypothetical protein